MWWAYEWIFFAIFVHLLKRVLALTSRLMSKLLKRQAKTDFLSVEVLAKAESELIKADQRETFSQEISALSNSKGIHMPNSLKKQISV